MANKEGQIRNVLIYILPYIASGLLPIITLPIFTRVLTVEDYGVYALASIYAILLSGIVNFGLTLSYERDFFQYKDKSKSSELLYSILAFILVVFLIAVIVTYVFKKPIARVFIGSADYSNLLFWVFFSTVIMSFKQYFLIYFKNTERAKDFVVYTLDETFISVIFSLFFVVYLKSGIIGLAWGQGLASIIILIFLGIKFLKTMPVCFGWEPLRDSLKISLPLTPRIFIGVISTQLNKYILNLLNTVGGVGIFSIAQRIANGTFIFMTAIQNVFNPHVYNKMFSSESTAGKEIGEYLTPFAYFSVFVCLLVSLFSEEAVRLLTGPSFYMAAPVVNILCMYYGFLFFSKINSLQIMYKKKTIVTSIVTIANIGLGIAISIPFIKRFGVIGAAWATFLGSIVTGYLSFFISQRYFYIKWETKKIAAIYGVFCASSILILCTMNGPTHILRYILKMLCVFVYIFLGMKVHILTRQNLKLLWDAANLKNRNLCKD